MQPDTTADEGARVLYADADESAGSTVAGWLEAGGHQAVVVADGIEALARVSDGQVGVALLHARLPRLDGYRTCAVIKRHPSWASTPVIIVASDAGPYDKAEARVVGADRLLSLPLTEAELLAAITQSQREKPLVIGAGRGETPGPQWMERDVWQP